MKSIDNIEEMFGNQYRILKEDRFGKANCLKKEEDGRVSFLDLSIGGYFLQYLGLIRFATYKPVIKNVAKKIFPSS